jgi:hypothetical protein
MPDSWKLRAFHHPLLKKQATGRHSDHRTKYTTREVGKSGLLMLLAIVSCPGLGVLNFKQVEPLLAMSK